jgi:hypothetical protein
MGINILDEIDNMPELKRIRRLDQMQFALDIFDGNGIALSDMIYFGTNLENRYIYVTRNRQLFMKLGLFEFINTHKDDLIKVNNKRKEGR